jgi:hypothetical protein
MLNGELAAEVRARLEDARVQYKAMVAEGRTAQPPSYDMIRALAVVASLESLVAWIEVREAAAMAQMEQSMGLPHGDINDPRR